ncbi:antA/AntB antirepressor family protein [Spirosoma spitsbergense]|uniref:antA/AntB antirepressor family protein n=1 Tax=Spirosoma spitsbergense TaxID=431554 RepID=UPI00036051F3|nr:antA/AntB antirepressor family protein [Spirosoma spitsbergense]
MNELIKVSTNGQGSEVVSARELYDFLEVKSKFADWIKNRIIKYGFLEDEDYVPLSKNLESGGKEFDYALTLDMAKQLSMVERNEKGKQARLYFIECEKALRQSAPVISTTEQVLLQLVSQSNQILASQSEMLLSLRADVDSIMHGVKPARPTARRSSLPGKQLGLPGMPPGRQPGPSLRQTIHARVVDYSHSRQASTKEVYNFLYKQLFYVYGIDVYRLMKGPEESILDAIERYGHLDRLYSLIMAELTYTEE